MGHMRRVCKMFQTICHDDNIIKLICFPPNYFNGKPKHCGQLLCALNEIQTYNIL